MIHLIKDEFRKMIVDACIRRELPNHAFMEKDYHESLLLPNINTLDSNLVFKGGTCLNKIYFPYFRLSEDLDFSLKVNFDQNTISRARARKERSSAMKNIRTNIAKYVEQYGLKLEVNNPGGEADNQHHCFKIQYVSCFTDKLETIKFDVGVRTNPILDAAPGKVQHCYINTITKEPYFNGGEVLCYNKEEIIAEKLCAAASRYTLQVRDYYDLDYILTKTDFNLKDQKIMKLFEIKMIEQEGTRGKWDGFNKYKENLGLRADRIEEMKGRKESDLYPVLTESEKKRFTIPEAFYKINKIMESMQDIKTLLTPEETEKYRFKYFDPREIDENNQAKESETKAETTKTKIEKMNANIDAINKSGKKKTKSDEMVM